VMSFIELLAIVLTFKHVFAAVLAGFDVS